MSGTPASSRGVETPTVEQGTSPWVVDGSGATQPVSAASLPLPAGAAKDSTLTDSTQRVGGTVAVTQSTTPWKSREDTVAMTRASAKNAAPAASAVQADTGQLAAGDYDFDIQLLASDTTAVGKGLVVEHRNAANNATLQTLGGCAAPDSIEIHLRRYTMATNERIRVIAGTAAGATSSMYVSAIGSRVS